jgi:peptidoglycan/LPS O-acetylase OafA/YrhL
MSLTPPPNHKQMTMADPKRLASIDVLRGVAAVLVVLQHSVEHYDNALINYVHQNVINFGQIGVLVFFMISGYVIPYSQAGSGRDLKAFWLARIFRIYPLYIFVILLNLILALVLFRTAMPDLGPSLLAHVIFVQEWIGLPNFGGPSWTLFLELVWYVLFAALVFIRREKDAGKLYLGLMAFLAVFLVVNIAVHRQLPFGKIAFLVSFFLGYITYLVRTDALTLSRYRIYFATSLLLTMVIMFVSYAIFRDATKPGISFLCIILNWSVATVIFLGLLFGWTGGHSRILIYIGTVSYSVYLLHDTVINLFRFTRIDSLIYVPLVLPATIALAHFTYTFVERPGIRAGKALSGRPKAPVPPANLPS